MALTLNQLAQLKSAEHELDLMEFTIEQFISQLNDGDVSDKLRGSIQMLAGILNVSILNATSTLSALVAEDKKSPDQFAD
ncbi:MAG: hypothetical protein LKG24_00205 [Lacticaseibacillus songhuajiangensis]|jgi:hypothetical protein|nr:hypothetical protein [Lacticaseibacillus songhuajiangensis]